MNINPRRLALSVYNSANNLERKRIKDNLNNFGFALFQKIKFSEQEIEEFKSEFFELANKGQN